MHKYYTLSKISNIYETPTFIHEECGCVKCMYNFKFKILSNQNDVCSRKENTKS